VLKLIRNHFAANLLTEPSKACSIILHKLEL